MTRQFPRKDDFVKYVLIGTGALIVVIVLVVVTHILKQRSQVEPDYRLVFACSESLSQDVLSDIKTAVGNAVGDANGDGIIRIEIQDLRLVDSSGGNIEAASSTGNLDDDFNRMALYLANGEYTLFLLSDEPSGAFRGAAATYAGYFASLPDDIADAQDDRRAELTGAPFLTEVGLEDIPIYGCVLESASQDEYDIAVGTIRALKSAHVTLW